MSDEIWRGIRGYEGLYEVSNMGRVRSVDRIVTTYSARGGKIVPLNRRGALISQSSAGSGYLTVCLCRDGKSATKRVAGLVCEAFHGPKPDGLQACHGDGNKLNNRSGNLRWGTAVENQADRILHGTDLRGERVSTAKLTQEQALAIKNGMKEKDARQLFGVSRTQFYRIKRGEAWAHLGTEPVAQGYEQLAEQFA